MSSDDSIALTDPDLLVAIAEEHCDLCRRGAKGHATIAAGIGKRTHTLRSSTFLSTLRLMFRQLQGRVPPASAVKNAITALEDQASERREERVFLRTGRYESSVYIDLGDDSYQAVKVDPTGWSIVGDLPVRFTRGATMMSLPRPQSGGTVSLLRPFFNLASPGEFQLLVTWCVAALMPDGPYPVIALAGEQGTGKTSFARAVHDLVDPSRLPLRALPRSERDLYISTANTHVLSFDNISVISDWLSDAFCKIATGGGFSTRALFTDEGEVVFEAVRPLLLNGIEEVVQRPDLADRAIVFNLPVIDPASRVDPQQLGEQFRLQRPVMFGVLLDLLALALARLPEVKPERLPRMAGFARIGIAIESVFGPPGCFTQAYDANRAAGSDLLLHGDPIAAAIVKLMSNRLAWQGTATDLAKLLGTRMVPPKVLDPAALAGKLRRLAPVLRARGIDIAFDRASAKGRTRTIAMTRVVQAVGAPLAPSALSVLSDATSSADGTDSADGNGGRRSSC